MTENIPDIAIKGIETEIKNSAETLEIGMTTMMTDVIAGIEVDQEKNTEKRRNKEAQNNN